MIFKKKRAGSKMKARISTNGITHIIVGLGNPGRKYDFTRHSAGFMALDYIASIEGVKVDKIQFKSLTGVCQIGDKKVLLMKPQTYMNLSGEAVTEAMRFYKVEPKNVLILVDDVSFDVGTIRIRKKGSDGGQNGLKNIFYLTGTNEFPRIKMGVGKKPVDEMSLADWVLSKFTDSELKKFTDRMPDIYEASKLIIEGDMTSAMNKYNG